MESIFKHSEFGSIYLYKEFIPNKLMDDICIDLANLKWSNHKIQIFGKWVKEPRRVAFYGDKDISYTYSKQKLNALSWTSTLIELRDSVNLITDSYFNSVLVNNYKDGQDYMGWHCDNEPELGPNPLIASLSFGETRDFVFRFKADHKRKINISLESGGLLIMEGGLQRYWDHALPKRLKIKDFRYNLTFRQIKV